MFASVQLRTARYYRSPKVKPIYPLSLLVVQGHCMWTPPSTTLQLANLATSARHGAMNRMASRSKLHPCEWRTIALCYCMHTESRCTPLDDGSLQHYTAPAGHLWPSIYSHVQRRFSMERVADTDGPHRCTHTRPPLVAHQHVGRESEFALQGHANLNIQSTE